MFGLALILGTTGTGEAAIGSGRLKTVTLCTMLQCSPGRAGGHSKWNGGEEMGGAIERAVSVLRRRQLFRVVIADPLGVPLFGWRIPSLKHITVRSFVNFYQAI